MRQVHVGAYHSHITTEDHRVLSYGWNVTGQCGVDSREPIIKVPTEITAFRGETIIMMASGAMHSHFVTANGHLWSVGNNAFGQLGLNSLIDAYKPQRVQLPTSLVTRNLRIRLMSCGDFFTIAIWGESSAYSWGRNNLCQVGATRSNCIRKPERCWALRSHTGDNIAMIACGSDHTAILSKDGVIEQFGSNAAKQFGQFLNGDRTPGLTKISLGGFSGARTINIAAYGNTTTALDSDGTLHMWGSRHTLHNATREGLSEHPEVIWRTPDGDTVRLIRMGRNHLHILTRGGMLYTWVYGRLKQSPSPFLPKTYYDYYQAKYEAQPVTVVAAAGEAEDAIVVVADVPPANASNEPTNPYALKNEVVPDSVGEDMAQTENVPLEEAWDDEAEFRVIDAPLMYLHNDAADAESESSSDEEEEEAGGVDQEDEEAARPPERPRRLLQVPPNPESDNGPRVALPRKPWKSYYVGASSVKDIACSAFTTQLLLFGKHFASEFRPLYQNPESYFSDFEITLSDGSTLHLHRFWMHQRCPALLSKVVRQRVIPDADPALLLLILKFLYYEQVYLSDLPDAQLSVLRRLLKQLKLNHSPLALALHSEVAFRNNELHSAELTHEQFEKARTQFQLQMHRIYELRYRTDFTLVASLSPAAEEPDIEGAEPSSEAPEGLIGNTIMVHKAILSIRVPFFEALFHSRFSDSDSLSHELDCTIETLDHFLRYIYYDYTNFSVESALWILTQSELLFVDKPRERLIAACSGILRRAGKRKDLKQALSLINLEFEPYEDGRELPEFIQRSTIDLSPFKTSKATATAQTSSDASESHERPSTSSAPFMMLEDSANGSTEEVELHPVKTKKKSKSKGAKKDKLSASKETPKEVPSEPIDALFEEEISSAEVVEHYVPPPRIKKSKKSKTHESSDAEPTDV